MERRERDSATAPFQAVAGRRMNSSRRSSNSYAFQWVVWDFRMKMKKNFISMESGSEKYQFLVMLKGKKMREWKKWRPMRLFRWEKLFVRGTKREILHCTFFMQKFSIWLATTKSFACTDVGISVFLYRNLFNNMNFCLDWFPKVTHTNLNDST